MLNTDFTHVKGLSLWTRQLHRGVAVTIDLTGASVRHRPWVRRSSDNRRCQYHGRAISL